MSLARRLWLLLASVFAAIAVVVALLSYRDARRAVDDAQDRAIGAALTRLREMAPSAAARAVAAESLGAPVESVRVAFVGDDGVALAGERDLPYAAPDAAHPLRFRNGHHHGEPVRVGALALDPGARVSGGPAFVVLSESAGGRVAAISRLVLRELARLAGAAAAFSATLWLWLRATGAALREPAEALDRRAAEDLSPLSAETAPQETRRLIAAINAHLARVAALHETSRRFAADVAHQLRTPLTLLGAQAQYALRLDDPDKMRAAIEEIAGASRAAQRLCNQMLALSRVEAAKGAIRDGVAIDLADLLRETALDLSVLAIEKRIDLAYDDGGAPAFVIGDEVMLHELFSNLIDNAMRYTPPDGKVSIALRRDGEAALVSVADGGPGIPPERRAAAFQRFHRRLDRTGASGPGLGLAIAHQVALAHGGAITFHDEPSGFCVRVRLPLRAGAREGGLKG